MSSLSTVDKITLFSIVDFSVLQSHLKLNLIAEVAIIMLKETRQTRLIQIKNPSFSWVNLPLIYLGWVRGKCTMKVVPFPSVLSKETVPPKLSVIRLTTAKPNP